MGIYTALFSELWYELGGSAEIAIDLRGQEKIAKLVLGAYCLVNRFFGKHRSRLTKDACRDRHLLHSKRELERRNAFCEQNSTGTDFLTLALGLGTFAKNRSRQTI